MITFNDLQSTLGFVDHEMISIFGADYKERDITIHENRFINEVFSNTSKIEVNLFFTIFKKITDVKAREYLIGQLLMQSSLGSKDLFYLNNYLHFASAQPSEYFLSINSLLKKSDDLYYDYVGITGYKKPYAYTMRWVVNSYIYSTYVVKNMANKLPNRSKKTTLMFRLKSYLHLDLKEMNLMVGGYVAMSLYDDNYITEGLYRLLIGIFGLKDESFEGENLEFNATNDFGYDLEKLSRVFTTILNVKVRWQIISAVRYGVDSITSPEVYTDMLLRICDKIDEGKLSSFEIDSLDEYCRLLSLDELK